MVSIDLSAAGLQHFEPTRPAVEVDRVLRIQGYPDPAAVRQRVRAATEAAIERTHDCLEPAVAWRIANVSDIADDALVLERDVRFECPVFPRFFARATRAAVCVFTIGPRFDEEVADAIADDNLLEAVLMESAGWLAVEDVTRQFTRALRDSAVADGLALTRRMSPGYEYQHGDRRVMWDLTDQQVLFGLFGDHSVPVQLLESSAMLPKMSRSGLIGLRPGVR